MDDINGWQFALAVVGGYLGGGIFQFPRELVDFAGPNAAWAYLGILALYTLLFWLFLHMARIDPARSVGATLRRVLTPVLGWPIQGIRLGLHFMLAVLVMANFGEVMRTFFLIGTPAWAIEAVLATVACYMAWYGTAVLARTLEALFVPTVIGSMVIGLLVVSRLRFSWALMPVGHLALAPVLAGTYHSAYIFIGFEVLVQLYGHVRVDRRQAAHRWLWALFGATAIFFAFGCVVAIGTEGPSALQEMQWPPVSALRLATISGFFISKLGLVVVVLWGIFAMAFVAMRLWCLAHLLVERENREVSVTWYHVAVIALSIAAWSVATTFHTVVGLVHFFQTWGLPVMMGYLVGLPILVLPVAWWRRRRVRRASDAASHVT